MGLFQITWLIAGSLAAAYGWWMGANENTDLGKLGEALLGLLDLHALALTIVAPLLASMLFWFLGHGSHSLVPEFKRDSDELAHDAIDVGYNVLSFAAAAMGVFAVLNIGGHANAFWVTCAEAEFYVVILVVAVLFVPWLWRELIEAV